MASKSIRFTGSTAIATGPGSLEHIYVGTHTGATIKVWDATSGSLEAGTVILGSFTPGATGSYAALPSGIGKDVDVYAKFDTALYITVSGTIDATAYINGDSMR